MDQLTCDLGHMHHSNGREVDACERRHRERALELKARAHQGLCLIQEQRYGFYVNRRAKALAS